MGTRSLTIVYDNYRGEDDQIIQRPIINLYRQYDGYPSGHGTELAEFLTQFAAITNGIAVGETRKTANGMGCLAAQIVAHFKDGPGQFYLHSVDQTECGQDYEYHVYENSDNELCVQVRNRGCNMFGLTLSDTNESLFDGPVEQFFDFCYEDA